MKALARFVGAVPDHDHPIELHDLLLEAEQLIAERGKTRAGNLRHPPVAWVGNNMQKFRNPFAPDARPGRLRATRRAEPLCDRREPHRRRETFSYSGRGNCRPPSAAASTASRPRREYPPRC